MKRINSILLLFFCFSCSQSEVQENKIVYSFFVAGHTYGTHGVDNVGLHPAFVAQFDKLKKDSLMKFGFLTGDIVLQGTEKNWNEVDSQLNQLNIPVYFAAGNHDLTDPALFESRYGRTYFSFSYNEDLFIVLCPEINGWNIPENQLTFIDSTLEKNAKTCQNIFVFFHQVLWWSPDNEFKNFKPNSTSDRDSNMNFWTDVEPKFQKINKPVFMFAGDVGKHPDGNEYLFHQKENITFVASGMGGMQRDNFVIVNILQDRTATIQKIELNTY